MSVPIPYIPQAVFSTEEGDGARVPRVLIAPQRYIQGDGILDHLGRYLSIVPSERVAILIDESGQHRDGARLLKSLKSAQIESEVVTFNGECSTEEVDRVADVLQAMGTPVDCVVAVGGGKCLDVGKSVAYRLAMPMVSVPTLASTDAPCSALAVMYTTEGVFSDVAFFPRSPALVAIDTRIVAEAPVRFLVAGIGDAMATWYEARTCFDNHRARSVLGARPTLATRAIGKLCADTLFEYGLSAVEGVKRSQVDDALESIVEANTLLSGMGFESGGLAVAHSVAQGLTVLPEVHRNYMHGDMVAIGLLKQLVIEGNADEARKVAGFFAKVGLPVHLGQISLSLSNEPQIKNVMEAAMMPPFVANEPFAVSTQSLIAAVARTHAIGLEVSQSAGDAPYRALHGN